MLVELFDDRPRTDIRPSGHLEETFQFLDRVRSLFFAEVRRLLNQWFAAYPTHEQDDLRRRLRSGDSRHTQAAFWELLLHELYRRAGWTVNVHPALQGTDRRPDFSLEKDGELIYLEARVATGTSDEQRMRDRRRRALFEAIDRATHPAFRVRLSILRDGDTQPPVAIITRSLTDWLDDLDPDEVAQTLQRHPMFSAAPALALDLSGWRLEFRALPLNADARGNWQTPMLSVLPSETYVGDPRRTVLKHKGGRYGTPDHPLLIALAIEEPWVHEEDVQTALLGTVAMQVTPYGQPLEATPIRLPDGYWTARSGRRVSGVLTAHGVRPWTVTRLQPHLWLNPWAIQPHRLDGPWAATDVDLRDGAINTHPAAVTTADLLDLPDSWPPGEAFGANDDQS